MYKQLDKPKDNKKSVVANSLSPKNREGMQNFGMVDNRPDAVYQREKQEVMKRNSQVTKNPSAIMGSDVMRSKVQPMNSIPETASATQLQQETFQLMRVIQRMVSNNLQENTQVFVKRSTSKQFHGSPAVIKGKGALPNEYVIDISGQLMIARCDQLEITKSKVEPGIEADMDAVCRTSPEELLSYVKHIVLEKIKPNKPFVVGGSFAVLYHAFSSGVSARTPRDIDIILDAADFGSGSKPKMAGHTIWGIPLELHKKGALVQTDEAEQVKGIASKDKLLAKELIKLLDQNRLFRKVFPKPNVNLEITAEEILGLIEKENDNIMSTNDHDILSDESKNVWMKTIVDIRTLVQSGATLAAYKNEKDPWK